MERPEHGVTYLRTAVRMRWDGQLSKSKPIEVQFLRCSSRWEIPDDRRDHVGKIYIFRQVNSKHQEFRVAESDWPLYNNTDPSPGQDVVVTYQLCNKEIAQHRTTTA